MARSGQRPAHVRLRRLLVMLPWLMERGEVSLAEMAAHFSLSEAEVVADLELAAMCGLPPFVDELIDVFIDEGMVVAGVPRLFLRPLRLTAPEGFGLLAAGRAAMALPGADLGGPLGRALDKLAAALGDDGGEGVVVDLARTPTVDQAFAAVERGKRLQITYWTPARDEATDRVVSPLVVFSDGGHWYLLADDERSGSERSFRLDRVLSLEPTGIIDTPRAFTLPDPQRWFTDDPDIERVAFVVPNDQLWMIERYPSDSVVATEASDGSPAWSTVIMPVTGEQWLRRLLLRLGPSVTVVSPERWTQLAADTARAVLARYDEVTNDS